LLFHLSFKNLGEVKLELSLVPLGPYILPFRLPFKNLGAVKLELSLVQLGPYILPFHLSFKNLGKHSCKSVTVPISLNGYFKDYDAEDNICT
jgi:hypothetical protein